MKKNSTIRIGTTVYTYAEIHTMARRRKETDKKVIYPLINKWLREGAKNAKNDN